jgi:hypothetical protein
VRTVSEASSGEARRSRPSRALVASAYAAAFLALIGAQLLRRRDVLDRVWAEDGAVFGREAFTHHAWESVGRGYAGYLVSAPRLLATPVVSMVRPSWWGAWFAIAATSVAALAALAVFRVAQPLVASLPCRLLLGAVLALGPKMRGEWPSIANVAWPLLMAMFWMIVSTRSDRLSVIVRAAVIAAATTSSAIALLFGPLVVAVLWIRRRADQRVRRADRVLAGVFGVSVLAQLAGMATAPGGPPSEPTSAVDIVRLIAVRVFGATIVGDRAVDDLWFDLRDILPVVAVIAIALTLILLGRRCVREAQLYVALGVAAAMLIAIASLAVRGTERFAISSTRFVFDADRYFLIPSFLIISALMIVVDRAGLHPRVAPAVAAYLAVMVIGTGLSLRPSGELGPDWGPNLTAATQACRADAARERVDVPVAPAGVFFFNVPCARLRGAGEP